jgi:hypothetical protein
LHFASILMLAVKSLRSANHVDAIKQYWLNFTLSFISYADSDEVGQVECQLVLVYAQSRVERDRHVSLTSHRYLLKCSLFNDGVE